MQASEENNWFGSGSQNAWDQLEAHQRLMMMMASGFQSVNNRIDKLTNEIDKLTVATCPHLIEESKFSTKVFSQHIHHSSYSVGGVWTVVRHTKATYAMSALHVPLAPAAEIIRQRSICKNTMLPWRRRIVRHHDRIVLPQYIVKNLKEHPKILVSVGALQENPKITDDFIMVELKDDIDLGDGKLPLAVSCPTDGATTCDGGGYNLLVAHTARGIVSALLPEKGRVEDDRDNDGLYFYTLSSQSQMLQNDDSGSTVLIENNTHQTTATGTTTWVTADETPLTFGSSFVFLGIYQGTVVDVGPATRNLHVVIPIPKNLVPVPITRVHDDGTVDLSSGVYYYYDGDGFGKKDKRPYFFNQEDPFWSRRSVVFIAGVVGAAVAAYFVYQPNVWPLVQCNVTRRVTIARDGSR